MKELKLFSFLLLLFTFGFATTSCSDDDDTDSPTYSDYFIECTSVKGGGFSSADCREVMKMLNDDLYDLVIEDATREEAIEIFDEIIAGLARSLSDLQPSETLNITFALKMTGGATIKTSTISITPNGSSVSRANEGYTITIE